MASKTLNINSLLGIGLEYFSASRLANGSLFIIIHVIYY